MERSCAHEGDTMGGSAAQAFEECLLSDDKLHRGWIPKDTILQRQLHGLKASVQLRSFPAVSLPWRFCGNMLHCLQERPWIPFATPLHEYKC